MLCGPILKAVQFEAFERPATLATLVALGNFSAAGDLTLTFHSSSRLFYTSCDFLTLRKYCFRDVVIPLKVTGVPLVEIWAVHNPA